MFIEQSLSNIYDRPRLTNHFLKLMEQHALVQLAGPSGSGKTYLAKSIENYLISSKKYHRFFWKPAETNYSYDLFIKEFEQYMPFADVGSSLLKGLKIIEYLEQTNSLIVFQNAES